MTKDEILAEAFRLLPDAQTYMFEIFTVTIHEQPGIEPVLLSKQDLDTGNFDADAPLRILFKKHLYYPEYSLSCKTVWQIQ
jgi:hypothetical protein